MNDNNDNIDADGNDHDLDNDKQKANNVMVFITDTINFSLRRQTSSVNW